MKHHTPFGSATLLSVLEGLQGGFAIFSGILAGLVFSVSSREILITTGLLGILVSGFNSSALKYTSEHFLDELDGKEKLSAFKTYFVPAFVEFFIYMGVCLVLLLPLLLASSAKVGVVICSMLTVLVLFLAGYYRGWILNSKPFRDGVELATSGLTIIIIGAGAGFGLYLLKNLF